MPPENCRNIRNSATLVAVYIATPEVTGRARAGGSRQGYPECPPGLAQVTRRGTGHDHPHRAGRRGAAGQIFGRGAGGEGLAREVGTCVSLLDAFQRCERFGFSEVAGTGKDNSRHENQFGHSLRRERSRQSTWGSLGCSQEVLVHRRCQGSGSV